MRTLFLLIISGILLSGCDRVYVPRTTVTIRIDTISMANNSIRAIAVDSDDTLWYAGANGTIGSLYGSPEKARSIALQKDSLTPHFRAISVVKDTVFALSIGNPALLYRMDVNGTTLVYSESHDKVFYDAMAFFDEQNGIAMGDPTENCLSIIITRDGGRNWSKINCDRLPTSYEGEAAFAASNTNIAIHGNNAWIVTGGSKARVFQTPDMGETWSVYSTPIIQGKATTGIYTVDFYDENQGIICGGDFTDKFGNSINKALTFDGGKTWEIVAENSLPKYVSCVQYVPDTQGNELIAVSTNGIFFSNDQGRNWTQLSEQGFYTIRFVDRNLAWLAGAEVIAKLTLE
jgi:photosystem II stability/assembly factor-like uncharacterized protein